MAKHRNITTTQLALMTAAAVISLRGLPTVSYTHLAVYKRKALGFEYGFDFRFVAEQYDAAVRPDRFKCQYGALNRRLRSEIAAHGIRCV